MDDWYVSGLIDWIITLCVSLHGTLIGSMKIFRSLRKTSI